MLDFGGSRGDRDYSAQPAIVAGGRGYHHDFTDLQHFRGDKASCEIAEKNIALFGVIVESQSNVPQKQSRPKAASFDTQWSLLRPFCAAGSTPGRIQTPADFRR